MINCIAQFVIVFLLNYRLWSKKLKEFIVPYICIYFLLMPFSTASSLQFSCIFYIIMIFSHIFITIMQKDDFLPNIGYYFFVIGIVTNYFDFLTYPLATWGIPAVLMITVCKDLHEQLRKLFESIATWLSGYFGFWVGKWVISYLLGQKMVIYEAIDQAKFRTSSGEFDRFDTIYHNITIMIKNPYMIIIFAVIAVLLMTILFKHIQLVKAEVLIYALIAIVPIGWFFVMSNHSIEHKCFVHKILIISFFSILVYLFKRCLEKKD